MVTWKGVTAACVLASAATAADAGVSRPVLEGCPAVDVVARAIQYFRREPGATIKGLADRGFRDASPLSCDPAPTYFRWVGRMLENDCQCCLDLATSRDGETLNGITVRWSGRTQEDAVEALRSWLRATGLAASEAWARDVKAGRDGMSKRSYHATEGSAVWLVFMGIEGSPPARTAVLELYRDEGGKAGRAEAGKASSTRRPER